MSLKILCGKMKKSDVSKVKLNTGQYIMLSYFELQLFYDYNFSMIFSALVGLVAFRCDHF